MHEPRYGPQSSQTSLGYMGSTPGFRVIEAAIINGFWMFLKVFEFVCFYVFKGP
jgi:hypothetical protein